MISQKQKSQPQGLGFMVVALGARSASVRVQSCRLQKFAHTLQMWSVIPAAKVRRSQLAALRCPLIARARNCGVLHRFAQRPLRSRVGVLFHSFFGVPECVLRVPRRVLMVPSCRLSQFSRTCLAAESQSHGAGRPFRMSNFTTSSAATAMCWARSFLPPALSFTYRR